MSDDLGGRCISCNQMPDVDTPAGPMCMDCAYPSTQLITVRSELGKLREELDELRATTLKWKGNYETEKAEKDMLQNVLSKAQDMVGRLAGERDSLTKRLDELERERDKFRDMSGSEFVRASGAIETRDALIAEYGLDRKRADVAESRVRELAKRLEWAERERHTLRHQVETLTPIAARSTAAESRVRELEGLLKAERAEMVADAAGALRVPPEPELEKCCGCDREHEWKGVCWCEGGIVCSPCKDAYPPPAQKETGR